MHVPGGCSLLRFVQEDQNNQKAMLLIHRYLSPQQDLDSLSLHQTDLIFPPALRQLVDGTIFSLNRAEFEHYLKKLGRADCKVEATLYARQCEAINQGLRVEPPEDGHISVEVF